MFSSAFKAFSSNITSNYEISKQPVASSGAWQIFDAKKKNGGSQASVFVFDRKSLEVQSGLGGRTSATSIRKVQDEVVERLKKEASSLARLRHPSILQLVEPVEETRIGGLMFATEAVTASLSSLLLEKDEQERAGGGGRTSSRYMAKDPDGTGEKQEVELDELEVQKGLLQVAKGLEFLHDSAKLVHGNLTPDAIFVNAKSDWKISGLAFAGPADGAEGHQPTPQISLSECLHHDQRIPRIVQLNLDYSSPDFVIDSNINFSADIFSLGLVILAIYNSPHRSPIETHGNQGTFKKMFAGSSGQLTASNNFLCSKPLPQELASLLVGVLARRPAQRMTAAEFQQSGYFDNILVNTLRFLDALPAKTSLEKSQFMRGLGRVLPQFPPSVLGRKVLSALLDELKDRELLPLILQNVFAIVKVIPAGRTTFPDKVLPRLREVFLTKSKSEERDSGKEAGLMMVLENVAIISENCSAKDFKDDILPIIYLGMESGTHTLVDASLQSIAKILPILDFSTVKHDLFPVVASVFSKTSSLSIKVSGLQALAILCGGSTNSRKSNNDDFSGMVGKEDNGKSASSLDKFTMQEKVVPLLKAIKTKEPAVMMAALRVFEQVAKVCDSDFTAIEVMPVLWSFGLGPLLSLTQFKAYMDVIKSLSSKIEREQIRKLQELSSANRTSDDHGSVPNSIRANGTQMTGNEDDFERLVLGNKNKDNEVFPDAFSSGQRLAANPPTFSWSSTLQPQNISRSITPDVSMSSFPALTPGASSSTSIWAQSTPLQPPTLSPTSSYGLPSQNTIRNEVSRPVAAPSTFSIPPPPLNSAWRSPSTTPAPSHYAPALAPPPSSNNANVWQQPNYGGGLAANDGFGSLKPATVPAQQASQQKTGLDKYQSLL